MARYALHLEYDGEPFAGWQRQEGSTSVQETVERALAKLLGRPVVLHGAGRTDAGVHARQMVAHFDAELPMPADRLPLALGRDLPHSVAVRGAREVAPDFDARRDARMRWYRYQILRDRRRRALLPRAWRPLGALDLAAMREATAALEGEFDFEGFRATGCTAPRTILTMRAARSRFDPDSDAHDFGADPDAGIVSLDFKCRSFLRRQVRLMVGGIVACGLGRMTPTEFARILETRERDERVVAAPPEGLCLMRIAYAPEEVERLLSADPPAPAF